MKKFIAVLIVLLFLPSILLCQIWTQKLNGRNVWSLGKDVSGNIYAGGLTGANSRIWKSTDNGNSWDTIYLGSGQTMWDFAFDVNENIYVANFSTGLLKSTNNGSNFSVIPLSVFNNKNLQGVECGSNGYVFVTSSSGFFRSTDSGQTFNETALTGLNCLPVIVDKDSLNIVYVGVSVATEIGIGVYRSTDNGFTFSNNLNPGKNGYNLLQRNNAELYMITTTSPYNFDRSIDKGLTWTTVSNLSQVQRGIAFGGFGWIYTGGNGGVFRSTDNGQTFTNFNFTTSTTPLLFVNNNNVLTLFAGTTGTTTGGVWKCIEGIIQSSSEENENVSDYKLFQNYPNPFNPFTNLEFGIPDLGFVSLKVYDLLGNEITTLVNEKKAPGRYNVIFDGSNFSSGIYYYRLTSGNFSITKKMILLK